MKHIKLFENFQINEMEKSGLEYKTDRTLNSIISSLKKGTEYKDDNLDSHKDLFSFFTYRAGFPAYAFNHSYLADKNLPELFKAIIKESKDYLKSGIFPEKLVDMLSNWTVDDNMHRESKETIFKNRLNTITSDFKQENKGNELIVSSLTKLIEILSSWLTPPSKLCRLKLAACLLDATTYSAYSGSDFVQAYRSTLIAIKKNKIVLTPTSEIKFDKDSEITNNSSTPGNGSGADFVQIDRTSRSNNLSITVDGKEFFVSSYNTQSAYGRY